MMLLSEIEGAGMTLNTTCFRGHRAAEGVLADESAAAGGWCVDPLQPDSKTHAAPMIRHLAKADSDTDDRGTAVSTR